MRQQHKQAKKKKKIINNGAVKHLSFLIFAFLNSMSLWKTCRHEVLKVVARVF